MKKGLFIVMDGCEGAGKSSMIEVLKEHFSEKNFLFTREPGGSLFAEQIRTLMLSPEAKEASAETQFGLVWAARHDHVTQTIEPALQEGLTVVSDRFDSSTFAYQLYGQKSLHLREHFWNTRDVYLKHTVPDLYVFFDVDPKVGMERVQKRKGERTHFDERDLSFHNEVRKGFKEFLTQVPSVVIDANKTQEEVKKLFIAEIEKIMQ
ncbi:MAG: dTMP kinase [Candidatus Paceibacterota bacterium]